MFQKKIAISEKLKFKVDNNILSIAMDNKTILKSFPSTLKLIEQSNYLTLKSDNKAIVGLYHSIFKKSIQGMIQNFKKQLVLKGLGYKVTQEGASLIFKLGYSHDIVVSLPKDIKIKIFNPTKFILYSHDWEQLTLFCSKLKKLRKINPYKGKGLFFVDETIQLKEGKKK